MKGVKSRAVMASFLAVLLLVALLGFASCGGSNTTTINTGDDQQAEEGAAPEDVAAKFFRAMEKQDVNALAGLFDPDSLDEIKDALGSDYKSTLAEFFFGGTPDDLRFKGLKYDTENDGKEATVDVVKGTVTYTDEYGDDVTEDLRDWEDTITFYMVKVKGKWYISVDTFPDLVAEYDIPEIDTDTDTDADTSTNPQPTEEYVVCPDCGGAGGWEAGADTTCYYCNGSGVQDVQDYCYVCGGSGILYDEYGNAWECDTCGGTGLIWDWVPCDYCGGTGLITESAWVVCETCEGTGWILQR